MSRYVIKRGVSVDRHDDLVDALVAELTQGKGTQPAFIEEEFAATQSRHVYVIWDRWSSLREDERTEVILAAYEKQEGSDRTANIALAVGLTGAEAVDAGLLPFVVRERAIDRDFLAYERAKSDEIPNTILGSRELRYPTEDAANDAKIRLEQGLPNSKWEIVREINRGD